MNIFAGPASKGVPNRKEAVMRKTVAIVVLAGVCALPGTSWAGGFSFSFGVSGKHGSLRIGVSDGHRGSRHQNDRYRNQRTHRYPQRYPQRQRVWVPAHYDVRVTYVHVPGTWRNEWVPPAVRQCTCCHYRTHVVRAGYWHKVWVPPHTEPQSTRVWVAGYWQ